MYLYEYLWLTGSECISKWFEYFFVFLQFRAYTVTCNRRMTNATIERSRPISAHTYSMGLSSLLWAREQFDCSVHPSVECESFCDFLSLVVPNTVRFSITHFYYHLYDDVCVWVCGSFDFKCHSCSVVLGWVRVARSRVSRHLCVRHGVFAGDKSAGRCRM